MADAIGCIDKDSTIQFVICCGDITNTGLTQEYEWYWNIIKNSSKPVITVIGNHDYLSNGYYAFNQYFGSSNDTFTVGNYKFILFDDIVWENHNRPPNIKWLEFEFSSSPYKNIFITHIPIWADLELGNNRIALEQVVKPTNTVLYLFGHEHSFQKTKYNGINTVVSASIDKRCYQAIALKGYSALVKCIRF